MSIDLQQVSENAVECFGLSSWNKQKIGALVLIFDTTGKKSGRGAKSQRVCRKKQQREPSDLEESTKESEGDDLDEGTVRRNVVPHFEAFQGHCTPLCSDHGSPCSSRSMLKKMGAEEMQNSMLYRTHRALQLSPRLRGNPLIRQTPQISDMKGPRLDKWSCVTPCAQSLMAARKPPQSMMLTQVVENREKIVKGEKPCAFKNLRFAEDSAFIPRRARSGDKKEIEQNINFHFWLASGERQGFGDRMMMGNPMNNRIKVIINKSSMHNN